MSGCILSLELLIALQKRISELYPDDATKLDEYVTAMDALIRGYANSWSIYDGAAKAAVNIFTDPAALKPRLRKSLFRIEVQLSFTGTAPKFFKVTTLGAKKVIGAVNNNTAFVTKVPISFDTQVDLIGGKSYNFQTDQDCNIDYLLVTEIPVNMG